MCSYSECVRMELHRHGVKVILIEPGFFTTELLANGSSAGAAASAGTDQEILDSYPSYQEKMAKTAEPIQLVEMLNGGKDGLKYVTDRVIDAVCSRWPLPRYVVGFDAHAIDRFMSYWPAWLVDTIHTYM